MEQPMEQPAEILAGLCQAYLMSCHSLDGNASIPEVQEALRAMGYESLPAEARERAEGRAEEAKAPAFWSKAFGSGEDDFNLLAASRFMHELCGELALIELSPVHPLLVLVDEACRGRVESCLAVAKAYLFLIQAMAAVA